MPDPTDFDDLDDLDDDDLDPAPPPTNDDKVTLRREDAKRLRGAAKRTKELEDENRRLKRERAFEKAGVDLDSKAGQFFAEHYDPDVIDPEKIREAAEEHGVPVTGTGNAKPTGPELTDDERGSTDERQTLAAGAAPDDGKAPKPDPKEQALKKGKEVIGAGGTEEEGIAAAIASQAQAAMDGDERAVIPSLIQ